MQILDDNEEIEFRVRGRKPFTIKRTAGGLVGAVVVAEQYTKLHRDVLGVLINPLINCVVDELERDHWRLNTIVKLETMLEALS